jgi:DNA-binding response OmpR family regulator
MPSGSILMIEDNPDWIELVKLWLAKAGYKRLETAMTGAAGLELAGRSAPDCVLLDIGLPDQNGFEVLSKLKALPSLARVPVVLLTALKHERVKGLESGADYFVAKSEDPKELLAVIDAVMRRRLGEEGAFTRCGVTLLAAKREVVWRGASTTLTPKAFALLHVLVERCPQPVSRADLYRLVEGVEDPGLSRALDVMLNRLRKSLPADLGARITAVKSFGYVFLDGESASVTSPLPRVTPL